jgi:hypothetical protein
MVSKSSKILEASLLWEVLIWKQVEREKESRLAILYGGSSSSSSIENFSE